MVERWGDREEEIRAENGGENENLGRRGEKEVRRRERRGRG